MSQVAKEIKKADQFSHIAGRQPAGQRSGSLALLQDNRWAAYYVPFLNDKGGFGRYLLDIPLGGAENQT